MNYDYEVAAQTTASTVSKVMLADVPEDGGKWVIFCDHYNNDKLIASGLLQDTNKARLNKWRTQPIDWCCYCQTIRDINGKDAK